MCSAERSRPEEQAPCYYRKLSQGNTTRSLAIGHMLPPDWVFVRIRVARLERKTYTLEITKLD